MPSIGTLVRDLSGEPPIWPPDNANSVVSLSEVRHNIRRFFAAEEATVRFGL
jgi:hypothetical protein